MTKRDKALEQHDNAESVMAEADAQRLAVLKQLRVVVRAAQGHSARIERQCGVGGAQLWLMQELHDTPGARVGEIAQRMAVHQSTVSNLLDTLDRKGYVARVRDTQDHRAVRLELTEAGRKLIKQAPTPARGVLPEALDRLNQDELTALKQGLDALLGVIGSADDHNALLPLPFTM